MPNENDLKFREMCGDLVKNLKESEKGREFIKDLKEKLNAKNNSEMIVQLEIYGESYFLMEKISPLTFDADIDKWFVKKRYRFFELVKEKSKVKQDEPILNFLYDPSKIDFSDTDSYFSKVSDDSLTESTPSAVVVDKIMKDTAADIKMKLKGKEAIAEK